jgi:hypothetical protein
MNIMANDSPNPRRPRSAATKRTSTTTAGSRTIRSARSSTRDPSAETPNRQAHLRVPLVGVSVPVPLPDRAAFYAGLTVVGPARPGNHQHSSNRQSCMTMLSARHLACGGLVIAALSTLAGCASAAREVSTGATVAVCGTALWSGAAAPVLWDLDDHRLGAASATPGPNGVVLVRLTKGCTRGVEYRFEPADAFVVARVVLASDHRPVAVRLLARRAGVLRIVVVAGSATTAHLDVRTN